MTLAKCSATRSDFCKLVAAWHMCWRNRHHNWYV